MLGEKGHLIRGGRVCKRAGSLVSFAPVLAVGVMALGAGGAMAQAGPVCPPDTVPSETMCDLGALGANLDSYYSSADAVSADGAVVVGSAYNGSTGRAFRWAD